MHDVIVVGARAAGASTAMLLARRGCRVLLLDRAEFPSDTLSTLYIHQPGAALLARWGLLKAVLATGCPLLTSFRYVAPGGVRVEGPVPAPLDDAPAGCAPRRYALDALLAEAAVDAGAEFRPGVAVTGLHRRDGRVAGVRCRLPSGGETVERARLVVGADGRNSTVARLTGSPRLRDDGKLTRSWYTYWSGIAEDRVRLYLGQRAGAAALTTQDGLTLVNVQFPRDDAPPAGHDRQRFYLDAIARAAPELRALLAGARREERLFCCSDLPNFFRQPYGPGWALVGDAVHHKDPITANGITDAFRQAELLATCLADRIDHPARTAEALRDYAAELDLRFTGGYEETLHHARLEPMPEAWERLRERQDDPALCAAFFRVFSGLEQPRKR